MIEREAVYDIYNALLKGEMNKEAAAEWAFNAINESKEFADEEVEDAMYKLVSFHDVGMIFDQYRPDDGELADIRDRLSGTMVDVEDDELTDVYVPDLLF